MGVGGGDSADFSASVVASKETLLVEQTLAFDYYSVSFLLSPLLLPLLTLHLLPLCK